MRANVIKSGMGPAKVHSYSIIQVPYIAETGQTLDGRGQPRGYMYL